jgi:hypothetical protein
VAFRSSRSEPFGEAFLRLAVERLLKGDVPGVRQAFVEAVASLRRREYSTYQVSSRVRLTKTPQQYLASRGERREHSYEAMLNAGRREWRHGDRVRVFRCRDGSAGLATERGGAAGEVRDAHDPRDPRAYDVEHYLRILRTQYAARLARAFTPDDAAVLFSDPGQESLFPPAFEQMRAVLREI